MIDRARRQEHDGGEHRPRHRGLGRHHLPVGEEADDRQQRREPPARAGDAQGQEQRRGQHRDVAAGDGDDVIDPALLQALGGLAIQPGSVADEHGSHDGSRSRSVNPHGRGDSPPDQRPGPGAPLLGRRPVFDYLDLQRAGDRPEQIDASHLQALGLIRRSVIRVAGRAAQPYRKAHGTPLPPLGEAIADERAADARPHRATQREDRPASLDPPHVDGEARAVVGGYGVPLQASDDPRDGVGRVRRDLRLEPLQDRSRQFRSRSLAGRESGQHIPQEADSRRGPSRREGNAQHSRRRCHNGGGQHDLGTPRRERPPRAGTCHERESGRKRGTCHAPVRCKFPAAFAAARQATDDRYTGDGPRPW